MKVPNFFILGAPRSGTTALYEYLKGNPAIFLSAVKEPKFFATDIFPPISQFNQKTYLSLFSKADPERHLAVGEATVYYLCSRRAVKDILDFNPNAKFVVMIRNPVDLAQSWHSQMINEGTENILDFEEAWRAEGDRRKGKRVPFYCWEKMYLWYSEWAKLGEQLERLFSIVSRENVKVIVFDDFVKDARKAYEEVLAFLNVPSDNRTFFPKINDNRKVKIVWLQHVFAMMANIIRVLRARLNLTLESAPGTYMNLRALNTKRAIRERVPEPFRSELKAFFREDVAKISNILSRDFSSWTDSDRGSLP
ncbi:MAG: sulfotransferase family protein [bacterium]